MSDVAAINAKIAELEAEMARTQKNKATNYHLGKINYTMQHSLFASFFLHLIPLLPFYSIPSGTLKAKIAKLKSELVNGPGGKSAGSKDAGRGFDVSKSGDTRIGLVGFPVSHILNLYQIYRMNQHSHPTIMPAWHIYSVIINSRSESPHS